MRWRLVAAAAIAVAVYRPALAADLPTPSLPPPLPVAVYNWTGLYLGINGGFGTGNSNWSDGPIGTTGSFPTSGFLIGGTAGINYQIGEYVFGVEGDGDWTNLNGNSGSTCGAISAVVTPPVSCQTQSQWLATVRGRVGYAFDRILLYGTAGAAFGNIQTGLNPPSTFDSTVEAGWTVGAGLELPSHKIGRPKSNICLSTCRTAPARPLGTAEGPRAPLSASTKTSSAPASISNSALGEVAI